ncbi:hypothetical protein M0R45_026343 [Rubus argutus]|uniref:PB1-like domain-containing protein n=1 Tax=Rubus argutus TaxID=59490 RepID=A0AAW1X0R4_RUBAR
MDGWEGFVLEIHHGGKFVEVGNGQHKYVGGEVHWLERLDPNQISCVELNTFAWRLGYRQPPVLYWFKHLYLPWYNPVKDDNDAMKMIETLPKK